MRFIFSLLLVMIHGCHAYAGFPPTTIKGQRDATQPTTFNFQLPFNQSTRTAGTNALIETGNNNILNNPGFEAETALSVWTASAGATATDTTTQLIGLKSVTWDSSASSQTFTSTAVAIPRGLYGRNGEASCLIQVASGTATHTLQAFDGTNILASQTVTNSTLGARTTVNFIFPSTGNIQLRLVSVNANEPLIEIDDCYLGEARNISQISQSTFAGGMEQSGATSCSYSESTSSGLNNFVALGTGTGCNAWTTTGAITAQGTNDHRAVYTNMPPGEYLISVAGVFAGNSGSGGTCSFRLTDGTTTFQAQTNGSGAAGERTPNLTFHVGYSSAAARTFQLTAADDHAGSCAWDNATAGFNASWKFYRFPTSAQQAINLNQTNYDWVDGGAITIGATTTAPTKGNAPVRDKVFYKREGQNLLLRYEFDNGGTGSASGTGDYLFLVPTASGCTIDTTRVGTSTTIGSNGLTANTSVVGTASTGAVGSSAAVGIVSVYSTTQLRFMVSNNVNTEARSVASDYYQLNSDTINYAVQASVPCVGWQENRGAPLLVGSISSGSSGALRHEYIQFFTTSWGTVCSGTPCGIVSSLPGVTVTRSATGEYQINWPTGTWSAKPSCTGTVGNTTNTLMIFLSNTNQTTSAYQFSVNDSGALGRRDAFGDIICTGQRQ